MPLVGRVAELEALDPGQSVLELKQSATDKVIPLLTTGNEKGSNVVRITRPGYVKEISDAIDREGRRATSAR